MLAQEKGAGRPPPASEANLIAGNKAARTTLVIGLGNPILGDDGVGWAIVRSLSESTASRIDVETDCMSVGGLSLMERMLGYDRVVIVDAIQTGAQPAGAVRTMPLADLPNAGLGHSSSAHDTSLKTALETAAAMGARTPRQVDIVAIEIRVRYDFSEELSPPVKASIPTALVHIGQLLGL